MERLDLREDSKLGHPHEPARHTSRRLGDHDSEAGQSCAEDLVQGAVEGPGVGSPVGMAEAPPERKQPPEELPELPRSCNRAK